MLKLLVITPYYRPAYVYGGPSRSVPALCEGMVHRGASVTVFTTNANGSAELQVATSSPTDVEGVEVWYFPRHCARIAQHFYYAPELGQQCNAMIRNFDGVYFSATWTYPMLAGSRAALHAGVPYIISPRGSLMTWSMSQKALKKRLYLTLFEKSVLSHASAIHCTSLIEAEQADTYDFLPPSFIVPNPVAALSSGDAEGAADLRRRLGVPEDGTLSVFTGRKHRMKRLDLMIQAFAHVLRRIPNAHLAIIGPDDGTEAILQELIETLHVEANVHLLGFMDGHGLSSAYRAADMVVMLSARENFGMAAAEALTMGKPVLLSKDVGLAAEVSRVGAGRSVVPTIPNIEHVWSDMLSNGDLDAMGRRAREYAERDLSCRSVAEKMLARFEEIKCPRPNHELSVV